MEKEIKEVKQQLQKNKLLARALFMVFFALVYSVSKFLIIGLTLFQLITVLLSEKPNELVLKFSKGLGIYIYQIIGFLTFNSEEKPFPFSPWPDGNDGINDEQVTIDNGKPD